MVQESGYQLEKRKILTDFLCIWTIKVSSLAPKRKHTGKFGSILASCLSLLSYLRHFLMYDENKPPWPEGLNKETTGVFSCNTENKVR